MSVSKRNKKARLTDGDVSGKASNNTLKGLEIVRESGTAIIRPESECSVFVVDTGRMGADLVETP